MFRKFADVSTAAVKISFLTFGSNWEKKLIYKNCCAGFYTLKNVKIIWFQGKLIVI